MFGDPARRRVTILGRGREAMLGRVPIADAHNDHAGAAAQVAAEGIVGLLVAKHPAAAVEIDHDRMRARRRRPVQLVGQQAVGALQHAVADLADGSPGRPALVELVDEVACALRAHGLDRRQVHLRHQAQHQPHIRLQAHDFAVIALLGAIGS